MAETDVDRTLGDPDGGVTFRRALDAVARFLALRDHSLYELKQKLSRRFDDVMIEHVLAEAEARNWLSSEEDVARRLCEQLSRRGKSRGYIVAQLRKRRLPEVEMKGEDELAKARELLVRKFGAEKLSYEDKAKAFRFLKYRGFEDRWIRKALNDEQP